MNPKLVPGSVWHAVNLDVFRFPVWRSPLSDDRIRDPSERAGYMSHEDTLTVISLIDDHHVACLWNGMIVYVKVDDNKYTMLACIA